MCYQPHDQPTMAQSLSTAAAKSGLYGIRKDPQKEINKANETQPDGIILPNR